MVGKIIRAISGFYYIEFEGKLYECHAKGILKRNNMSPMVGDNAEFEVIGINNGNLARVVDRKNQLIRPPVANVDMVVIVVASKNPEPSLLFIDKQLIFLEKMGIKALICLNKTDIGDVEKIKGIYEKIGYEVILTSALENEGVELLREKIDGKTIAFVGNSGVGKSSLSNKLYKKEIMIEGDLSKIERGKQTTRHCELINLGNDTYIIDTPGFSSFEIVDITPEELPYLFVEFKNEIKKCEYRDCKHILEGKCGIKEAINNNIISRERYENFKIINEKILSGGK